MQRSLPRLPRMLSLALRLGLILVLGLALGACGRGPSSSANQSTTPQTTRPQPTTTEKPLVWQGTILEKYGDTAFLAHVDVADQAALGDKAHVQLYATAVVVDHNNEAIELGDIPIGGRVRVTITCSIRESYPVQVSATRVVWLDSPAYLPD